MPPLQIIGDVLWIIALSIMSSASLTAWRRIPADVMVPMQWGTGGKVIWRAKRRLALTLVPVVAFVVGVLLVLSNRNAAADPSQALVLFGVRAVVPAIFALLHLRWLKAALSALEDEGKIDRLTP